MTEMTKFNVVRFGVPTQVGVAGKDFPASCVSKMPFVMGVLAVLDQPCNSIKMPQAFITTINIFRVIPRMANQHTFT